MDKYRSNGEGAGVGEGNGLRPAGEAVNNCEQMVVTHQRWKWAYEIYMDVLKAFLWRFKPFERSLYMDFDLVALVVEACAGSSGYIRWG